MIFREDRDAAVDRINVKIFVVLLDWIVREKRNLDSFIAHPQGHVDFNPYIIVDFDQLQQRSGMLGQIEEFLNTIVLFKSGSEDITRAMHDNAIDHIPNIIWERLRDWTSKRADDMNNKLLHGNPASTPLKDYSIAATFDSDKYIQEMTMYQITAESLNIMIEFANEEGLGQL